LAFLGKGSKILFLISQAFVGRIALCCVLRVAVLVSTDTGMML